MDIRQSLRARFALVLLIALSSCSTTFAADLDDTTYKLVGVGDSAARQAINQVLDTKVPFAVDEMPLQEFAKKLSAESHVEVLLDEKHLTESGVETSAPITMKIGDITLRSALRRALAAHDLKFVVANDSLLITTPDLADATLETRAYQVPDLVPPAPAVGRFAPTNAERLILLVTRIVSKTSWGANGGAGSIAYLDGRLIVTQTQERQTQVAILLAGLSTEATRQPGDLAPVILRTPINASASQRIDAALEKVVTLDLSDVPLAEAVERLGRDHGLPVAIDRRALEDSGVSTDQAVSLHVAKLPLRTALSRLLAPLELDYMTGDEQVLITTPEIIAVTLEMALYPIADLVGGSAAPTDPRVRAVMSIVTTTCHPQSWDENGGAGNIMFFAPGHCLVVVQTERIHAELRELIAQFRAAKPANIAEPTDGAGNVVTTYDVSALAKHGGMTSAQAARQLVAPMKTLISPKNWGDGTFVGEILGRLVVSQTPKVHEEIEGFLKTIGPKPAAGGGGGSSRGSGGGGFFALPKPIKPVAKSP